MKRFTGLGIVIPTIDEIEDIKEVVSIILSSCKKEDISDIALIYAPFSDENFVRYLHSFKEMYPDVVFNIACQKGKGVGDAVRLGISMSKGSHITMIGADMENDPHDIAVMAELSKKYPDCIITGSRNLLKDGFSEYPRIKIIMNRAFQFVLKVLFRTKGSDVTYLFQSTPIDIIRNHKFLCPEAFVLELALLAETQKLPVIEFPSKVYRRQHGSSHLTFRYHIGFMKATLRIFFKMKRVEKK
ncbi:MAG: glycosyltransferase [Ruminococcaceae bacterium]|nr:glycosyltransferase [Oscillospiraceae bacterium]